ncbi:MAG: polysaccharide deacetylase family protein, partial [bacterium]|nr:polysaccharide deacetylase family protein [bacterium]
MEGWGDFTSKNFIKTAAVLLCAGFLFFGLAGKASAATYYVKWDAAGAANGTSWTDAYTTIQAAITARTTSGSVIEISGGTDGHTYTETLLTKAGNITIQGSTVAGHSGTVTVSGVGGSTYILKQQYDNVTINNLTLTDPPNGNVGLLIQKSTTMNDVIISNGTTATPNYGVSVTTGANVATVTFNRITIRDFINSAALTINGTNLTFIDNYGKFIGNSSASGYALSVSAYAGISATFNNCLFVGNYWYAIKSYSGMANVYVNNCIFDASGYSNGLNEPVIYNSSSGAVTVSNSLIMPDLTVSLMGAVFSGSVTDGVGNVYALPQFVSTRRPPIFVIGLDDSGNFNFWTQLADLAETYGYRITLAAYTDYSPPNWTTAKTYTDKGHEISSHTRTHQSLNATQFLTIRYTGAGTAATLTVDVPGNYFRTYVDSVLDVNLDLSSSSYDNITEIVNYLNAHGNYTATIVSINSASSPQILADVSGADIKTSTYAALINQARMFAYEIDGSKSYIEAAIPGYTVKTLVLPGGNGAGDATIINAVQAAGLLGIRNVVNGTAGITMEDFSSYKTVGFQANSVLGTTASDIAKNVSGMISAAGYMGDIIYLFDHGANAFSLDNWRTVFDTLHNSNAQVMTYSAAMEYVRANGVDADGNQQRWTRTFTDQSNYNLQSISPAIDVGTNLSLTTDYLGNPIYGLPDIGGYEYQPPYTVGTTPVPTTGSVRVYSDGQYRALVATSSAATIS